MTDNIITKAVELAGGPLVVAKACGLKSYQAVLKWMKAGKLPRTEWTGETDYCSVFKRLTKKKYTRRNLLQKRNRN